MNLSLRQLSVFSAVAQHLSYTKAAQVLHLSQPAVSMQVSQLEDTIGLPLFEKLGRKIHLTEAGREVYTYAQRIANDLRELEGVLESLRGISSGRLRISVATTANHFATRLLGAFSQRFAGVDIALDVTNRKTLLDQLAHNQVDLVIMGEPPAGLGLSSTAFMDNPLVVVAAPRHPLAGKPGPIPFSLLADETFVVREAVSGTRIAMNRFFQRHGFKLHAGMEMTSNEAIKQAVEAGLGLGIVSIHTLELELAAKRLVILNVEEFPIVRQWHLVQLADKRLSPVAQAFKDFLLGQEGKKLMSGTIGG